MHRMWLKNVSETKEWQGSTLIWYLAFRAVSQPLSFCLFSLSLSGFTHASPSDRQYLIDQILGSGVDPPIDPAHSPFIAMVKDQYGNYVCQKMLDEATPAERTNMINRIRQFGSTLKKIPYGKHIIARIEKLTGQPFNTDADETSSLLPIANGQSPLSVPSSANSTSVLPIESNLSIPVASSTAMTFTSPPGLPVNPLHRQ